ncbi:DUF7296 family protein [Acinetobacter baumannii]|uniref:DUF7296 family protein n=1 Tax=Acinetobacter baumannii TaxID=470 RepID=UPI001EF0BCB2|nr:hypothetical protein [Acinetobacter baumannii]MCG6601304.1 hypothetical protein [Acinetobacter baumannii]
MFWTVRQNNSGGYFIQNDVVDEYLCVEANSVEEAEKRIEKITEDYSEFCPCCGERWSYWFDKDSGQNFPHNGHGDPLIDGQTYIYSRQGAAIIHYLDGRIEKLVMQKN